tara:strand:+ start:38 stop:346 length:309 start_codon:yes stop_codon:yes gene_type:complete
MDIESKVKEILQDPEKRKEFLKYEELDNTPKKLIDAPHEIVFTVEANILEQNEKHENIGSRLIHKTNFHMPVPEGKDAMEYMDGFLQHFQQCLLNTEEKINE